ncbi:MAG: hypothetical protein ABR514_02145 [Chthoniobacterales bacterium]
MEHSDVSGRPSCLRRLVAKGARDAIVARKRTATAGVRGQSRYLFHEYFHGDTGIGLGASHQTGWTALVAKLIQQQGEFGTIQQTTCL